MALRLSDSWLDELRARVNIIDVISDYVALKQKGRKYWGLCPFHSEKTPSFSADADSQLYYCFGCHKGGTVIHFVMDLERLEFMEAVQMLAERAHLPLPDMRAQDEGASRAERDRIYEANLKAAEFYHNTLWTPEGAQALNYLYRRGLDDVGIRRFGLGATPQRWEGLTEHLLEAGFDLELLKRAGLSQEKENRRYDAFRNRVIFPIINPQGRVLGFGGRAVGDGQPKYLNTAETPVFNKRQGVYALNLAKKERNLDRLILVEGYMDVVSLRQQGILGAVATLGTALSEEQARLLKRYAPRIVICYDGDAAGQKAILRALDIFESQDVPVFVLDIPDEMDPDDYVRKHGVDDFLSLKPLAPPKYRMLRAADGVDLSSQDGRTGYAIECANILRSVRSPVELENYLTDLVTQTGFSRAVLLDQIGATPAATKRETTVKAPRLPRNERESDFMKAEIMLIQLIVEGFMQADESLEGIFLTPLHAQIVGFLANGESRAAILDRLPEENRHAAAGVMSREGVIESDKVSLTIKECLATIYRHKLKTRIEEVKAAIDTEGDAERKRELLQECIALQNELNATSQPEPRGRSETN